MEFVIDICKSSRRTADSNGPCRRIVVMQPPAERRLALDWDEEEVDGIVLCSFEGGVSCLTASAICIKKEVILKS